MYYFDAADNKFHNDYVSANGAYPHTNFAMQTFVNGFGFVFGWKESDGAVPYAGGTLWKEARSREPSGHLPILPRGPSTKRTAAVGTTISPFG